MTGIDKIKPAELGARLKAARTSAKITQEIAAGKLGVARTTIVAIENGERQVKPAELVALANLYGASVNSLVRESAIHFDLVPQFRRSNTVKENQDLALEAARVLQRLASASVELERLLGLRVKRLDVPEYRIQKVNWADQAEDVALDLRNRLGLGLAPIADIFVLAEEGLGVRLFFRKLASSVAGVFAYHPEVGACIMVNSVHPWERRCWTCAHELAHLLTNKEAVDVSWAWDSERGREERFADRFAAAFLMPAAAVRIRFNQVVEEYGAFSVKSLFLLARSFNVSFEAMGRRLEQLALLRSGTFDGLKERGLSVKKIAEAVGVEEERGDRYYVPRLTVLALKGCETGLLTEGQVCDLLGLDRVSVRKLADALKDLDNLGGEDG